MTPVRWPAALRLRRRAPGRHVAEVAEGAAYDVDRSRADLLDLSIAMEAQWVFPLTDVPGSPWSAPPGRGSAHG